MTPNEASFGATCFELFDETGLPDPGLSPNEDDTSAALARAHERAFETLEGVSPSDVREARLASLRRPARGSCLGDLDPQSITAPAYRFDEPRIAAFVA